jgi:hypothetical protein
MSDRDFTHEADPLVLPSVFGAFPKDKYFTYPELNPKKGKIGFALGDRKKIHGEDVINNAPVDFEDIVDLESDDLLKKGFVATAAEIASCSYVIGADCPASHIAGALGVQSIIVLTKHHDARFGMAASGDRETLYKSQSVIKSDSLLTKLLAPFNSSNALLDQFLSLDLLCSFWALSADFALLQK